MAECVYCKSYTQMYVSGSPVCIECAEDLRLGHKPGQQESAQNAESKRGFAMTGDSEPARCPSCGSTSFNAIESTLTDHELLECESCLRAFEVRHAPDGSDKLVAV